MTLRVVAAFIEEGGKVLVQQRPAHKPRGGRWEFPGGKVDAGESDDDALRREIREELGIGVAVEALLGEATHSYGDLTVHLVVYRAERRDRDEPILMTDAQQIAWQEVTCLPLLDLCEADRKVVALADNRQQRA